MKDNAPAGDKVRRFQLYLLSFMQVSPVALTKALQQLNSTDAELEAVARSMKGLAFEMIGGPNADFYYEMLGGPISNEPLDNRILSSGFYDSRELRFRLPLWPDFDLVVNVLPDGGTFDTSFRRSKNVPVQPIIGFSDLQPWKFVREEVDAQFGSPQFVGAWDNWEEVDYVMLKSPGERPQKCSVIFDFNLPQSANCEPPEQVD